MTNIGKFFSALVIAGTAVACNNAPEADVEAKDAVEVKEQENAEASFMVDPQNTQVSWVGFKTYAETVHNGSIAVKEGKLMTEGEELVGGTIVIDMTNITNDDLPEEGDYNKAKLIGHLKSEDFFHVEEHPEAKFEITGVEAAEANNEKGATHMISGNLTMRGQTKNITIPAMVEMTEESIMLTTPEFVIDRTNWGVEYGSTNIEGLAKDKLIDDNIKLEVELEAKKA